MATKQDFDRIGERRRGRRPTVAATVALALAALPGCRSTPDRSALSAGEARALVLEQARAVHDFSAGVSLSIETKDFEGSLSGALVVEPPDRMRLRATKLMQDVFDMVVTPERIDLYWFRDRTFFRKRLGAGVAPAPAPGPESSPAADGSPRGPEAFLDQMDGRLMRFALAGFELPDVVASIALRQGGDFVIDETLATGERVERRFDGRSLFLERVRLLGADGAIEVEARYGDHELYGELWFPTEIELDDRKAGIRFEMVFDDVALNEGILPGAFELAPPPGVEVRER